MGTAIIKGLAGFKGLTLHGMDLDRRKVETLETDFGLVPANSARELTERVEYLLVAVKPQHIRKTLEDLAPRLHSSQTVISIAAGVTLAQLKTYINGACPVVRVMPNTPAMVQAGVFAVCFDDPALTEEQKSFVKFILTPLGQFHILSEKDFAAFTAVAGCGPAYAYYFMEALVEAGVSLGLYRDKATEMVKMLFFGSSKLALMSENHLSILRETVTSPGGTTIAATNVLDERGVRGAIIAAVKAAKERDVELSQNA
jgi:pyrroline-5-carboxylate reductase